MRNNLSKFIATTALASGIFAVDEGLGGMICGAYDATDPDTITAVQAAVDAALEAERERHEGEIEGLKNKNKDLLERLRKARTGEGGADTGEIERLERELEETSGKLRTAEADLRETKRQLTRVEGERDTANKTLETESAFSRNMLVENGLTAALVEAKVDPDLMEAAKALLGKGATVKVDGDSRTAVVGDKPLGEFIKEWAASDQAKRFILAPANGGGGANNANASGGGGNKKISEMSEAERTAHYNAIGQVAFDAQVESERKAQQAA